MRYLKKDSTDNSCYGVDLNRNFDFKWMGINFNDLFFF